MNPDRNRALAWIGRRRALTMALLFAAIVVACGLLLDETAAAAVGLSALVAYGGYCALRPVRGYDAFWPLFFPGPLASVAESLFGIPRPYVGAPLLLLAFAILWDLDRKDARERDAGEPVSPPAPEPAARRTSRPAP